MAGGQVRKEHGTAQEPGKRAVPAKCPVRDILQVRVKRTYRAISKAKPFRYSVSATDGRTG